MTQALMETVFDVCYLCGVIAAGLTLFMKGGRGTVVRQFGAMAVLLGAGDSFHLIPRMVALWTTGLEANAVPLGVGKLVTSVTMTVFYLILYQIWRAYYRIEGRRNLTRVMWGLTAVRIALCLLPGNDWLSYNPPLLYGVLRNIPFAAMGILIIYLFRRENTRTGDPTFRNMPLAVALSFGFYVPVVLFSAALPSIGLLMMPKTLAYVWVVAMGWKLYRRVDKPLANA